MTKNIEDLLYRGDSLERMGELSGRLREDSKKYRKAAVRINWELMLKQVSLDFAPGSPDRLANHRIVRTFRWRRACHLHSSLLAILLIACSAWPSFLCMNVCIVNTSVIAGYNPPILESGDLREHVSYLMQSKSHPLLRRNHLLLPYRRESGLPRLDHRHVVRQSMATRRLLFHASACR